jgi:CspA family cold shock protein
MSEGKIKRMMRDRGYGFIAGADGKEVFFHRSELQDVEFDDLSEGDSLQFEVAQGAKGPQAVKIKRV